MTSDYRDYIISSEDMKNLPEHGMEIISIEKVDMRLHNMQRLEEAQQRLARLEQVEAEMKEKLHQSTSFRDVDLDPTNVRHERYMEYVTSSLKDRIMNIPGVIFDESKVATAHTEKMYTIRPIDNPKFSMFDTKETIYSVLGSVVQKYYNEIEKLKTVFCPDKNLYILIIQAMPINVTGDKHEMRMFITVTPE